jgi:hypothetical protein
VSDPASTTPLTPDFSGLFAEIRDGLKLVASGMGAVVHELRNRKLTFVKQAAPGISGRGDQLIFQGRGVVRSIHNPTSAAVTVYLADDQSAIFGTAGNPLSIASGATAAVWQPFTTQLRATVSGQIILAGEIR